MKSHTQSVVSEPNRRRITGSISYKPLISDISVLRVCNKTGGTIKGDLKKKYLEVPGPVLGLEIKYYGLFSALPATLKWVVTTYFHPFT